jgi:S1-C subfamily serine protease
MKKFLKPILLSLLCISITAGSALALGSCSLISSREISSCEINSLGELIVSYSDGSFQNLGAVAGAGNTTLNIDAGERDVSAATAKGLMSAVSVSCKFEKNVNYGYGYPGYGSGATTKYSAAGAGVIYRLDKQNGSAFIITNYHVVYDKSCNTPDKISDDISVYLYGAESASYAIPAEYVGGSLYYDIAVLRVEDSELLKRSAVCEVTVSDKEATVGQTAIAVGNPESYGISASLGIVSVDSEHITMTAPDGVSEVTVRVIRVDTAVNSGNSGGGLYNGEGELIGIVNAKIVDSSVENIGYAIPAPIVTGVADNVIDHCYKKDCTTVMRALLGVTLGTTSSGAAFDTEDGSLKIVETVTAVTVSKSGVAYGKIEVGDILKSATLNGKTVEITRTHHIIDLMLTARTGNTLTVNLLRDGEAKTVTINITADMLTAY